MAKYSVFLIFILVGIMTFFVGVEIFAATHESDIDYTVIIRPGEKGMVNVLLKDVDALSIQFTLEERLSIDVRYLDNISNFAAKDIKEGIDLPVEELDNGWEVNTSGATNILISYTFGTSFKETTGMMRNIITVEENEALMFNKAVFLVPDIVLGDIVVEFDIPDEWDVGTHFVPLGDNRFFVEKKPNLAEDMLYNATRMGVLKYRVEKRVGDIDYVFSIFDSAYLNLGTVEFWRDSYGATVEEEMVNYIDLIAFSVDYLTDVFGFWPGSSRYNITTSVTSIDCLHSLTSFKHFIKPWTRERHPDAPHHVAHAWIWFDGPIHIYENEFWLILEGVPMYYQAKLMHEYDGYDKWLGLHYAEHLTVKRANQLGVLDKPSISNYALSHMQILFLDKIIQEKTAGERNIEDVFFLLGQGFGIYNKPLDRQDFIAAISDVVGEDMTEDYHKYFAGYIPEEIPPTADFIEEYQQHFFEWMDSYSSGHNDRAELFRTMILISLEIGIHFETAVGNEHFVVGRAGLENLTDFYNGMQKYSYPLSEEDIIKELTAVTGVDQSDFFDFYTIGDWRPRVSDVEAWLFHLPKVTLTSPANNASVSGRVTFKWNPDDGATRYQLQIRKTSDNSIFRNQTLGNVTQRAIPNFSADGTQYRWRVRAGNEGGWGPWSVYWNITSGRLPRVILKAPGNNATIAGRAVTFRWRAADGATKYQVQIRRANGTVFKNRRTPGNVLQLRQAGFPNDGSSFKWRVRAGNEGGWGMWSVYRNFRNGQ